MDNSVERNQISEAVRKLRTELGESQQAFAYRLQSAVRTIARWETVRPPRGAELGRFYHLAINHKYAELADVFARAMELELDMRAERIPRTMEESLVADASFWRCAIGTSLKG